MTDRDIYVTLERPVTIPEGYYTPGQVTQFYAVEFSEDENHFNFVGVPVDEERTCAVSVRKEAVRGIVHLGPEPEEDVS